MTAAERGANRSQSDHLFTNFVYLKGFEPIARRMVVGTIPAHWK
jgi:hypothetical protein